MKLTLAELGLFLVTTLLSVHANAQSQKESSTIAGFNVTTTDQQETLWGNVTVSTVKDITVEQASTTNNPANVLSVQTSPSVTQKEASSESVVESTVVQNTTEQTASEDVDSLRTTQVYQTTNIVDKETNSLITKGEVSSSPASTEKTTYQNVDQTTAIKGDKQLDEARTASNAEETTSVSSFKQWFDGISRENLTQSNVTDIEGRNRSVENEESTDAKNKKHGHWNSMNPDIMPPREFMEWLDSIHPDLNATTTKNIIDTRIISTEKLIIVISTICGTFVLFVVILIAISCCKRNRNIRNDSEKSDFSMTSVVSVPEKRKSDVFSTDKNGFNNLFMGIPANNEVWKNLEQLSPAAPSVMPESTKM
ncbi:uncharacterized protein LOC123545023 [Mercenaria mercenaria]|uniref:uncharacterized protein LOC123545023 n=1 Tax=Mercenaria mercenaria TaxID=6596 RepID=UPI00234F9ED5|nr:uncharacterized protein LOC123545023 [Mercenaria mercenaria]